MEQEENMRVGGVIELGGSDSGIEVNIVQIVAPDEVGVNRNTLSKLLSVARGGPWSLSPEEKAQVFIEIQEKLGSGPNESPNQLSLF